MEHTARTQRAISLFRKIEQLKKTTETTTNALYRAIGHMTPEEFDLYAQETELYLIKSDKDK